jgi:NAD(P)-dependent dehydrogenase (short-subunit alcohol dehydrogenase family)
VKRVAVVTGAARGIGAATCERFQESGWDVVGLDTQESERTSIRVDVGDAEALADACARIEQASALVNNAAVQLFKPLAETTVAEWDSVQAQNLRSAFVAMQALRPQLAAGRGAVVNVASVHALATSRSVAAYAAGKGGLLALTRAAALELAADGIRVNAVLPGAIDTEALREGLTRSEDAEELLLSRTPLGRIGSPQEVAEAILFLADGSRSSFVTGQTLVVDGGALARLSTE